MEGIVKWFNKKKRFGFIVTSGGNELFVHATAIKQPGPTSLVDGQKVSFFMTEGDRGPEACDVEVLQEQSTAKPTEDGKA